MSDTDFLSLIVGSGDINARGNASKFSVALGTPLVLSGAWEVTFSNINYPKPVTVGNSVFVFCSLCKRQPIGSNSERLLCRLEPTRSSDPDPVWRVAQTLVPWRPVAQEYINSVDIQILESDGTPIPSGAGRFTTVELALRKIM